MYDRFTDRARKVMQLANYEAQGFNHEYLGTEHILLGLAKEGGGVAAQVLNFLGFDLRSIRIEVEKRVQYGSDMVTMGRLPQTAQAKKVIECAMAEARSLNHNYVGTEHLLLGLLKEGESVASEVLERFGLTLEETRVIVLRMLKRKPKTNEEVSQEAPATPAPMLRCNIEFCLDGTKGVTRLTSDFVRNLHELRKTISDLLTIEEALALAVWTMQLLNQLKSEKESEFPLGSMVDHLLNLMEVTGCATVLEAISVAKIAYEQQARGAVYSGPDPTTAP